MKKLFTLMAVCLLALVSGCGGQQSSSPELADKGPVELHVSAAASLTDVMNEIGKAYEQEHPDVKVVFNYGSSGALQQAIENGGAADLFFSAAQKQMDALDKQGLLADGTREDLLQNEVVLIVPKEGGRGITSFDALTGDAVAHVALGEPKGVPVGQYSEEILTKLGLLDDLPDAAKADALVKPTPASSTRRMLLSSRRSALSRRHRLARISPSFTRQLSSRTRNISIRQRISWPSSRMIRTRNALRSMALR